MRTQAVILRSAAFYHNLLALGDTAAWPPSSAPADRCHLRRGLHLPSVVSPDARPTTDDRDQRQGHRQGQRQETETGTETGTRDRDRDQPRATMDGTRAGTGPGPQTSSVYKFVNMLSDHFSSIFTVDPVFLSSPVPTKMALTSFVTVECKQGYLVVEILAKYCSQCCNYNSQVRRYMSTVTGKTVVSVLHTE